MKGIILAGGAGTRLYPVTKGINKQLAPIYDKPMIYYPLSVLMLAGIRDILIISNPRDLLAYEALFSDGEDIGLSISCKVQSAPEGIAEAFIIGEEFIGEDDVCLILGDNFFYGQGLTTLLDSGISNVKMNGQATIFGYYVSEPGRYGVPEFNSQGQVSSIEEKPTDPKSSYAIVGLYFYPNSVVDIAKSLTKSSRGELEITSVNQVYLGRNSLSLELMGRGFAWLDVGTHDSLMQASNFIQTIEQRQGLKVACLEEIAFEKGYIDKEQLVFLARGLGDNQYSQYLIRRAEEGAMRGKFTTRGSSPF